ncbi:MAG: DUF554 domain-containing protein [Coriobacteriia bacterium]|nr:DUF554 domain-containing protein [Coriobacteriia bacterium]
MFPGLGTLVNTVAVALAGAVGSFVHGAIPERFHRSAVTALGLAVIFLGASQALGGLNQLSAAKGHIGTVSLLIFSGSLIVGTLIGEWLRLEDHLEGLGHRINSLLQKRSGAGTVAAADAVASAGAGAQSDSNFVEAFMTASLIYCVGAMTVLGSIQDGLGNPQTLFVKALLDGVISIFLASSLGIGVSFAAIPVLVLQGLLALAAHWIGPLIPALSLAGLEAVGGVLIAGIGINLVFKKKLPVGNMLPSVFLAMAVIWLMV